MFPAVLCLGVGALFDWTGLVKRLEIHPPSCAAVCWTPRTPTSGRLDYSRDAFYRPEEIACLVEQCFSLPFCLLPENCVRTSLCCSNSAQHPVFANKVLGESSFLLLTPRASIYPAVDFSALHVAYTNASKQLIVLPSIQSAAFV